MPKAARSARILGFAAAANAALSLGAPDTGARSGDTASFTRGKAVFEAHCVDCHGPAGHGDGRASGLLLPRPSDLTAGRFKMRSTPQGSPPTDDDLLATVTRGIPNSAMPSFAFLSTSERRSVVRYLKSLSPVFDGHPATDRLPTAQAAEPPQEPSAAIAAGKAVYEKLQCAACHGAEGRGDGPAADLLRDAFNLPVKPRNFVSQPFKGGHSLGDIYLRITTGMEGTPMAAFAEQARDSERWQLARFVQSLCEAEACKTSGTAGAVVSKRLPGGLPSSDPLSAAWRTAPRIRVPLNSLWNAGGAPPPALEVRSLNDGRVIAFLLEWNDRTGDTHSERPEDFRDAVAIQFARTPLTSIAMGSRAGGVTIWHWKADWQAHVDRGRRVAVTDIHPWMVADGYPLATISARDAGNPFALEMRDSPAEEATASGFGTLTSRPADDQHVAGKGVWRDGRWHVVISRSLASDPAAAVSNGMHVAFAVWNGSARDRAGQKAISTWYRLKLEPQ